MINKILYKNRYSFLTAIIIAVVYLTFTLQYETNDDPQIMNYISGLYTGEPCVMPYYMQAPYSFIIACLYRITTAVSWYSIAFLIIDAAAIIVIGRIMVSANDSFMQYIVFIAFVEGMYLFSLVQLQYTTVGGLTGAAGILLIHRLGAESDTTRIRWQIAGTAIFMFLAYNVRNQCGPVVIIASLYVLLASRIVLHRKSRAQILAVVLGITLIAASHGCSILYSKGNEWEDYAALQDARGRYMDYNRLPYDEAPEIYETVGWDESTTEIVRNWCFRLKEANTEDFAELNSLIDTSSVEDRLADFSSNLMTFVINQKREMILMGIELLWLLFILGQAILHHDQERMRLCIYMAVLFALQTAFIGYLVWEGRYKRRAMYMVYYICSTPLFAEYLNAFFAQYKDSEGKRGQLNVRTLVRNLPVVLLIMLVYLGYTRVSWRTIWTYDSIDEAEAYVMEHPENIYMGDNTLMDRQRMFRSFDKDHTLTNLLWWGSWLEGAGFDYDQLRRNGFEDIELKDMLQEGRYFIGANNYDIALLDDYYKSHFDNVTCEVVYETENIIVYNYSIAE